MIAKDKGVGASGRRCVPGITVAFALGCIPSGVALCGSAFTPLAVDRVFATNIVRAVEHHPSVVAAKMREQAAGYRADGLGYTFRSPELRAASGYAQGSGDIPGISLTRVAPNDALTVEGGVEAPVGAGLYAGAGVAERVLTESEYGDDLRQTAAGGRLRMPLLRDFKYGLHAHEFSKLRAEAMRASADRMKKQNETARDALLAHLAHLQGVADMHAVENAVKRAEKLCEQTTERSRLQDVAAYQVFPTRYEVALRKEELEESRQTVESRFETLRERLGLHGQADATRLLGDGTNDIVVVAKAIVESGLIEFRQEEVLERHPACLASMAALEAANAARFLAEEKAKDSLELSAGAGWRGETESGIFGDEALETSENALLEVGIVWRRSLDKRGVRSDAEVARAEVRAAMADARIVENEVLASLARAQAEFASACGRLELAFSAIEEARKTLTSEEQRFNLGEGTSRNVLDAQKDLTTASRRGIAVAGTAVNALVELAYAAGFNPLELVAPPEERARILQNVAEGE